MIQGEEEGPARKSSKKQAARCTKNKKNKKNKKNLFIYTVTKYCQKHSQGPHTLKQIHVLYTLAVTTFCWCVLTTLCVCVTHRSYRTQCLPTRVVRWVTYFSFFTTLILIFVFICVYLIFFLYKLNMYRSGEHN